MQMRAWCLGAHSVGVIFHHFSKRQNVKVKRASIAVGNAMHQIGLQTTHRFKLHKIQNNTIKLYLKLR